MLVTNLLTNMVVVHMGLIQTNTAAFEDYERQTLTSNAQVASEQWHLDTNFIASNKITDFSAEPRTRGPSGQIIFAGRYKFWNGQAAFFGFADESYCWPEYSGRHFIERYAPSNFYSEAAELVQQWARSTNHLTMKQAEQIAESALRSVNIPINKMRLRAPKVKQQIAWTLRDGTRCLLPYYTFDWKPNALRNQEWCKIDVSGISGNIAFFSCGSILCYQAPTNYLQLLGCSTNTVFVTPIKKPGQKGPLYEIYPFPIPLGKDQPDILY